MPRIRIKVAKTVGFHPAKFKASKGIPKGKMAMARTNLHEGAPISHAHVKRGDLIKTGGTKRIAVLQNKNGLISGEKRDQYSHTTVRIGQSEKKRLTFHGTTPIHKAAGGSLGALGPRNSKAYDAQLKKKSKSIPKKRVWNGRGYS